MDRPESCKDARPIAPALCILSHSSSYSGLPSLVAWSAVEAAAVVALAPLGVAVGMAAAAAAAAEEAVVLQAAAGEVAAALVAVPPRAAVVVAAAAAAVVVVAASRPRQGLSSSSRRGSCHSSNSSSNSNCYCNSDCNSYSSWRQSYGGEHLLFLRRLPVCQFYYN